MASIWDNPATTAIFLRTGNLQESSASKKWHHAEPGQYVVQDAYFQHTDLIGSVPVGTYGLPEQCLKENTTLTVVKSKTFRQNGFGKSFSRAVRLATDSLQVCKMSAFKMKFCSNFTQVTITLLYVHFSCVLF